MLDVDAGDAHDPDQDSDGSGSSDAIDGDGDAGDDDGEQDQSSSNRIVTSFNLDDVSSSEEEQGDGDDESEDEGDELQGKKGEKGGAGKRVHWGEKSDDEDQREGAGSKRRRQEAQANVFAGVSGEGGDTDASMEEQMRQLDQQDEKARKAGGGVAGQGELRRAREALRCVVESEDRSIVCSCSLEWRGHAAFRVKQ